MSKQGGCIYILTGYARSGKDTAGAYLVEKYSVKRWAFADKLKEAAKRLTVVIPFGPLSDQAQATVVEALGQAGVDVECEPGTENLHIPFWDGRDETKRHPCVQLGKVMRDVVDPVIWVRAVLEDEKFWSDVRETGVVLTDCRYLNEWRMVVDKAEQQWAQVEMIWLERDGAVPQGEEAETTSNLKPLAVTVPNNGTITELQLRLDMALGRGPLDETETAAFIRRQATHGLAQKRNPLGVQR